jgi:hypothetical protein
MKRPGGDGSSSGGALIPATGSMVPTTGIPATNPAGTNPMPMTVDDGFFFYQPVQAYFQFVQNNLKYINESNIDNIRQEAGGIAK